MIAKKWTLLTLISLATLILPVMLNSVTPACASPEVLFTVNLLVPPYPHFHEMAWAIQAELAKIGINVELSFVDAGTMMDRAYGNFWDKTYAQGGWDMELYAQYHNPMDAIWYETSFSAVGWPPMGWNHYSYNNSKADTFLRRCLTTYDKNLRQQYLWRWQEELAHDPPQAVLYSQYTAEIINAKLRNWDPAEGIIGWSNATHLYFEGTTREDYVTLKLGAADDLYWLNPMFTYNIGWSDELVHYLTHDLLMKMVRDPVTGQQTIVPSLAADYPVYAADGLSANLTLRQGVRWHDGVKFNATDVKFTFDALLDPRTLWATGAPDYTPAIRSVEILNEYKVRFNFKAPCAHFETLLANSWGAFIIPEHIMRGVPHNQWWRDVTNTDPAYYLPGTGPWKFVTWVPGQYWEVEANKDYFLGEPMIDHIFVKIFSDPAAQLVALQKGEIDIGRGWSATRAEIEDMMTWPSLKVSFYATVSNDYLGFNLVHPILSNRYVRQAICHAIPYDYIISNIKEGLAIRQPITCVTPQAGWQFNTELKPHEYDLAKAQQYMDMWKYSQPAYAPSGSPQVDLGPVGDSDFSGYVELPDFYVWARNFGKRPGQWPWAPGRDLDPDFDNNEFVELPDFYKWTQAWGKHYPFEGAR